MATYKEIAYLVLDELKLASDDRYFELEHVVFLLDKYRSYVLKKQYGDMRKVIPSTNYQTIVVDLVTVPAVSGDIYEQGTSLKSIKKIPTILGLNGNPLVTKITIDDLPSTDCAFINKDRFKNIGYNSWTHNCIYCTIDYDNYLYFKSGNPIYLTLEKLNIQSIFEVPKDLFIQDDTNSTYLDMQYPLEESLIPPVVDFIMKELLGANYRPQDKDNDSKESLSEVATK